MYAGVDVGGSKVLAAVLDAHGVIKESFKFPTPPDYEDFLKQLRTAFDGFKEKEFRAGGVGIPSTRFDRDHGIAKRFSNLPWTDVPIHTDAEKILDCPVVVENDAKLACLSETVLLKGEYDKVLYVTISTGIGFAMTVGGELDTSFGDGGGRTMMLEHEGRLASWESFASGKAIVARYGKKAMDITDQATWQRIVRDLAPGFLELIAIFQPDVIVIGGSVGTYFDRYGKLLAEELNHFHVPLLPIPPLRGAQRPEEAVVYGCYEIAKQTYGAHHG